MKIFALFVTLMVHATLAYAVPPKSNLSEAQQALLKEIVAPIAYSEMETVRNLGALGRVTDMRRLSDVVLANLAETLSDVQDNEGSVNANWEDESLLEVTSRGRVLGYLVQMNLARSARNYLLDSAGRVVAIYRLSR